eukprot:scaffold4429_cov90-Isochrysis_galbana.AAC.1
MLGCAQCVWAFPVPNRKQGIACGCAIFARALPGHVLQQEDATTAADHASMLAVCQMWCAYRCSMEQTQTPADARAAPSASGPTDMATETPPSPKRCRIEGGT